MTIRLSGGGASGDLLQEITASTSATIDFDNLDAYSAYRSLYVVGTRVIPSTTAHVDIALARDGSYSTSDFLSTGRLNNNSTDSWWSIATPRLTGTNQLAGGNPLYGCDFILRLPSFANLAADEPPYMHFEIVSTNSVNSFHYSGMVRSTVSPSSAGSFSAFDGLRFDLDGSATYSRGHFALRGLKA